MKEMEQFKIRPYARLLTMLGEQLIKNERIALIELLKNSYDADSDWVKVSFIGFTPDYKITKESKIIIEDCGTGMTTNVIENHWLNPATPEKKRRKQQCDRTKKGRVIQGEKGIGRFSVLKLGRKITIISRVEGDEFESVIEYDFSKYDDDFLTENGIEKDLYIDDISIRITKRTPERIVRRKESFGTQNIEVPGHGTIIEVANLKGTWTEEKIDYVYQDFSKFESIFNKKAKDFAIYIYRDDVYLPKTEKYIEKLDVLMENRAVIRIENGYFDHERLTYSFGINGEKKELNLNDPEIAGLKVFRDHFKNAASHLSNRDIECGSFTFGFYIFDFTEKSPMKFRLDKDDKRIIRDHRIYLYRDDIRVYPYGEPDDDWLKIDTYRGTISAGSFLSNDQVVGYVNITQKGNPKLKDKTNREGLIEEGNTTEDFIVIIQSFLAYVRHKPYARYKNDLEIRKRQDVYKTEQVYKHFEQIKDAVGDNKKLKALINNAEKTYEIERRYLVQRAETTEDLAGVGLSVESASHDIMGIIGKVLINLDSLISDLLSNNEINQEILLNELQSLRGGISFVESQLKDVQLLFKSSKQRRKNIRVKEIVEKVERIYRRLLTKENIILEIQTIGSPLVAKTTDAVLLQLLLNLFDNSVFWLQQISQQKKMIKIVLDGNTGKLIFSDNGPGVKDDDAPYIFEPFYSGKGEDGRGLGLYIARQLLERNDYSIDLAELSSEKVLTGANFVVCFLSEEQS